MPDPAFTPRSDHLDFSSRSSADQATGSESGTRKPVYSATDPPTVRKTADQIPGMTGASSSSRVEIVAGTGADLPAVQSLPRLGERIDRFLIEESIGVGGMGAVFRALDERLDRQVALKILPPEQANDTEVVQRFYQEGRAAARLDHENIARVYTIGNYGRYHHIAFEYIEGTTLRQRVEKNGPLPVGEAIKITLQIADALVHAAERGVVHRDIKPSNIIVTPLGRAKLVDMGLARRFERGGDDGLTQSGMTLGTFDYISPEQARDPRNVDVRSDLYSLGCTLFHMLTGRPPFPEGTVLQKLISHQEEAPPDIHELNAAVPPDLASILVKLMAKNRDRRYQTPEHLMRDLLSVAGALGLRSVSPEGLVWLESNTPPVWERHFIWGFPVLAFTLIISALLWLGRDSGSPSPVATADVENSLRSVRPVITEGNNGQSRTGPKAALAPRRIQEGEATGKAVVSPVREITVESTEELLAAIATAPARSVIVVSSNGPFNLGTAALTDRPSSQKWSGRDLTIRADSGVRPVLRLARESSSGTTPCLALLEFFSSHVTIEGLEFLIEPGDRVEPLAAIRAEDSEITIRRCIFRRIGDPLTVGAGFALGRVAAIEIHSNILPSGTWKLDRPPALSLDKCHIDGKQVGVLVNGAGDVSLRDCTIATTEPAFVLDNSRLVPPAPVDLRLRHVSIMAAASPVFQFEGATPRLWIDDSVVGSGSGSDATLVATDTLDTLIWHGRSNLYSRVATFLLPLDPRRGREAIREPSSWKETADDVREVGSVFLKSTIWAEPRPFQALATETQNPTRLFRLAAAEKLVFSSDIGVRQGPLGTVSPPLRLTANKVTTAPALSTTDTSLGTASREVEPTGAAPSERITQAPVLKPASPPNVASVERSTPASVEPGADSVNSRVGELPEMPVMPPVRDKSASEEPSPVSTESGDLPGKPAAETGESRAAITNGEPAASALKSSNAVPSRNEAGRADTPLIRTANQLRTVLGDPASRPGLVRLVADADWELAETTVHGPGSWRIQAEAGKSRPRLRFLPAVGDGNGTPGWSALFGVRSGSLQLEGIDLVLPRANGPRNGRWAAFLIRPGTYLNLVNCTITIEGDQTVTTAVAVTPSDHEEEAGANAPDPLAATFQATDCLFRVGGDLVDITAGNRLVLELNDVLVATSGSVVHAHGLPRGQVAGRLGLTFRQVTARMGGGLVHLEGALKEPELPVADVNVRDSIFTTSVDSPLIRVEGQDVPATMRDRVVWEGHGVGYHNLSVYRRDQSAQVGSVPTVYDRPSWIVAVGSRELAAYHGDLKFREEWDEEVPAWSVSRDDARLAADTPVATAGCDVEKIPATSPPG